MIKLLFGSFFLLILWTITLNSEISSQNNRIKDIDASVKAFLEKSEGTWQDLNVPEEDAKTLYNIILKNRYRKALEIGTSTGRSGIWIAWALSKTGGKLITIEIDKERYKQAVANFREAGLSDYIDARLADAHTLVKELKGPFDFVFCDADKDWYKNYFLDIFPKLEKDGCFAAHNVWGRTSGRFFRESGTEEYYNYVKSLNSLDTTVYTNGAGLSVSYKK